MVRAGGGWWLALGAMWLLACAGTRTGNPVRDGDVPKGAKLVRSALERENAPDVSAEQRAQLGSDQRAFSLNLYRELASAAGNDNLFASPYGIWLALAMAYAGAEGETEAEMASALRFGLAEPDLHAALNAADLELQKRPEELPYSLGARKGEGMKLEITNALFAQAGLAAEKPFLDTLARHHDAGLYTIDFGEPEPARKAINEWIAERTKGRIEALLPRDSLFQAAFVLVNALFFKATWLEPFEKSATADGVFHGANGDVTAAMMHGQATRYADEDGYQAVELPYVSPAVRMLIVLPDADRFEEVQAALDGAALGGLQQRLADYDVHLQLPKFTFSSQFGLNPVLRALGMNKAFDADADFSGLTPADGLAIGLVQHQAFVAVDEEGTEATAATAVVFAGSSAPPPLPEVDVAIDRPFIFAIYDEPTGLVLFLGRVMDASK